MALIIEYRRCPEDKRPSKYAVIEIGTDSSQFVQCTRHAKHCESAYRVQHCCFHTDRVENLSSNRAMQTSLYMPLYMLKSEYNGVRSLAIYISLICLDPYTKPKWQIRSKLRTTFK